MHIVLVTDAWFPQVNGVVRTWSTMRRILMGWGHTFTVIHPEGGLTMPAPTEPSVRLSLRPRRQVLQALGDRVPDVLHIATEGPLGLAARRLALQRKWHYTTSFHTLFPEYLRARMGIPAALTWRYLQWFHAPAARVLIPNQALAEQAASRGLTRLSVWARGVDATRFAPGPRTALDHLPRPIFMAAGRLAKEKNLDAFLSLDLPGSKVVVGAGPEAHRLRRTFPNALFLGNHADTLLAAYYNAADVLVFPSRADTFGLVMLEAMACGTPVAAFDCDAPRAVIRSGVSGYINDDLRAAAMAALSLDRRAVRARAQAYSWEDIALDLLEAVVPCAATQPLSQPTPTYYNAGHT